MYVFVESIDMKLLLFGCLLWNAVFVRCFYVPGVGPRDFMAGESVDIKVCHQICTYFYIFTEHIQNIQNIVLMYILF